MWQIFSFHNKIDTTIISDQLINDLDLSLFQRKDRKTITIYVISIWIMQFLKIIHLFSDIYTCIKLLAFNTWSNQYIQPYLSFKISKWLFSGCIIFSILLLFWEGIQGLRIYQTHYICYGYINNFSRRLYCLYDFRIFCLFDKITPSGFFQRLTFFCFFELKNCIGLLFADSPRQIINGLTLWSVLSAASNTETIEIANTNDTTSSSVTNGNITTNSDIINRFKIIAQTNHEEAVMLLFMFISFIIWLLLFLKFTIAIIGSIYVYYQFSQDNQFNNIREYIIVTVSYNLDYLIEKYKYKNFYSRVNLIENSESEFDSDWELDLPKLLINDNKNYNEVNSIDKYYNEVNYTENEMSKISFIKTPDTMYSVPSYYYH